LRHFEVIDEASARLSETLRARHPEVPWREIIGMRNVLIHGYFDIDWEQVNPSNAICPVCGEHLR
jgi:uncharacterized protein with HEPN domain